MSDNEENPESRVQLILKAIENQKYKSRTIEGIAKETGIPDQEVKVTISSDNLLKSRVMVVSGVKKNNQPLYVTVERYKRDTPVAVRILNLMGKKEYSNE